MNQTHYIHCDTCGNDYNHPQCVASTDQYPTQQSLPVQIVENILLDYAKKCLFSDILIKL